LEHERDLLAIKVNAAPGIDAVPKRANRAAVAASAKANHHDTSCEICYEWRADGRAALTAGAMPAALPPHKPKLTPARRQGTTPPAPCIESQAGARPCNCRPCRSERATAARAGRR
jgi:hypothetical protein